MSETLSIPPEYADIASAISDVCHRAGVPNPAAWLATVMTGRDPRPMSAPLVEMIRQIAYRAFDGESSEPDSDEWAAIVEHVLGSGLYEEARVGLRESQAAAQELMKYVHARRQALTAAVDVKGVGGPKQAPEPLTAAEIGTFRRIFDDVY